MVRIHNLPDFVYFNHAQHVQVGQIECQPATDHGRNGNNVSVLTTYYGMVYQLSPRNKCKSGEQ